MRHCLVTYAARSGIQPLDGHSLILRSKDIPPATASSKMPRSHGKSGGKGGSAAPYGRKRDKLRSYLNPRSRSASPSSSGSVPQQAVPPNPSTPGQDLWTKAYQMLPDELKQQLGMNNCIAANKLQTLQDLLATAVQAKDTSMAKRLNFKWGDKEINVQEVADRLVGWITRFKEIGDIAVQYDPTHATLPWAGVRFILLVRSTLSQL